jgi:transposase
MARQRRYPSDLTDEQWAVVEPLLPPATRHPRGGRRERHPRRAVVDAVLYVVRTGCSWRQLPADFPPWQTVYWYFVRREEQKATTVMLDALREQLRAAEGRDPEPTAGLGQLTLAGPVAAGVYWVLRPDDADPVINAELPPPDGGFSALIMSGPPAPAVKSVAARLVGG